MSRLRVTVVGCSGSVPGPGGPASCYLVEADDDAGRTWRVVLDLGNGSLGALQRHVDPVTLDGVLLSHLHADHCLDLCGLYVMVKHRPGVPAGVRVPVWGPTGTAERVARAYDTPDHPGEVAVAEQARLPGLARPRAGARRTADRDAGAGAPPGRGVRAARRGRRRSPGLHRRHRRVRGAQPALHRRRPRAGGLGVRRGARHRRGHPPVRTPGRRRRHRGRRRAAPGAHARPAVERRGRLPRRGALDLGRAARGRDAGRRLRPLASWA
nr:MBL fold metallo-hydrolase [Angustibacter aerolatus]